MSETVSIDIQANRPAGATTWQLPSWGHPLSRGVLPLFLAFEGCLFPLGTAFSFGRGVRFVATATHNVREAWKREQRLAWLLNARDLPTAITHHHAGFSLLYQDHGPDGRVEPSIWPLETFDAAPPTDVIIGYPQFQLGMPLLVNCLSFALPAHGETVWSAGYTDFTYPDEGIPLDAVRDGSFNWFKDYGHALTVVESTVRHVFVQRFAPGYLDAPCFTFNAEIPHGLSGGPVMLNDGRILGINSAAVTSFFDEPTSVASLLFPLLVMNLRFGAAVGPMRIDSRRSVIDLIGQGVIQTDGTEERVTFYRDDITNVVTVAAPPPLVKGDHIYDDFSGFQARSPPTPGTGTPFRLRRNGSVENPGR